MNKNAGRSQSRKDGSLKVRKKTADLVLLAFFTAIIIFMTITPFGYIPLGVINATIIHVPVILGSILLGPVDGAFLGAIFGLTSFLKNTYMPSTLSAFVFSPVLAFELIGPSGIWKSAFICFVPRILVGMIPYYVFKGVNKLNTARRRSGALFILALLVAAFLFAGIYAFASRAGAGAFSLPIGLLIGAAAFILIWKSVSKKDTGILSYGLAGILGALTNTLLVMPSIFILYKDAYAAALGIAPDAVFAAILGVISFNGVIEAIVAGVLTLGIGKPLNKAMKRSV